MSGQAIRLPGLDFANPGLPRASASDYELAIDATPGLKLWLSPEPRFEYGEPGAGLRERARRIDMALTPNSGAVYTLGRALAAQPSLHVIGTDQQGIYTDRVKDFRFMEAGYSIVTAVKIASNTGSNWLFQARIDDSSEVELTAEGGSIWLRHAGDPVAGGSSLAGAVKLVMASWADDGTAAIWVNGASVGTDTIAAPDMAGTGRIGIGSMNDFDPSVAVDIGDLVVLDRPLHKTANDAIRTTLFEATAAKYGVTLA